MLRGRLDRRELQARQAKWAPKARKVQQGQPERLDHKALSEQPALKGKLAPQDYKALPVRQGRQARPGHKDRMESLALKGHKALPVQQVTRVQPDR